MLESFSATKKQSMIGKKVINSSVAQKDKPFNPPQQQALSYHISKQYHQQNRFSSGSTQKVLSNSRNNYHQQQSIEDSQYFQTKTISINLNQLAHSSSQSSLKSTQQVMRGMKSDLEQVAANMKKFKNSFRENSNSSRVQTARQRKSPSPHKIIYNLDSHKQYQSIVNEKLNHTRNQLSRSKKSIDSKISNSRLSTRIISSKKDSLANPQAPSQSQFNNHQIQQQQQQQAVFRTTVSSVTSGQNSIKNKSQAQSAIQQQQQKIVLNSQRPSTAQMNQRQQQQYVSINQQQAQSSSQGMMMTSFDNKKQIKQSVQSIDKNRLRKRISEMASPGGLPQQSPRLTLGAGSTTGATSVYSVTTESIINQSGSNTLSNNQRKMCLSEKLAPKGKKKRTNAHKQPKQITITRDQIILQPFLSIYSTQNGGISGIGSGQHSNFNTQHDIGRVDTNNANYNNPHMNNSIQSNIQMQMVESKNNVESTPITNKYNDMLSDDQDFFSSYQRNMSKQDLLDVKRDPKNMFSFHNSNEGGNELIIQDGNIDLLSEKNQSRQIIEFNNQLTLSYGRNGKQSMQEESKEVTGIFGSNGVDNLGTEGNHTHGRPSYDANDRKPSSKDVHTPVFQTKSQNSLRPSDVVLHLDVKLCDDSPLNHQKQLNQITHSNSDQKERLQLSEVQKNQLSEQKQNFANQTTGTININITDDISNMQTTQVIINDLESEAATQSIQTNQQIKKVYSTSNLELSRGNISVAQTSIMQRNDSNGSFFSRIKNYFGGKPQSQIIDLRQIDVQYRCRCGQSGKMYACKRAMKWLSFSNNYSEMEYEKNKQLYLGLTKFNTASGSETQIERDIPRTFPNADPYMSTTEGQQKLSRVLNAFSKYFTSIGYVQGMNFIVGALLMHCSEDIAFWLFVSLIEDFEMRDIYQPKLPGLYKHSQVLQLLQMEHLEKLYYHFSSQNILIEMYASDWIFALFSNIIPITEYHHFLDQFFLGGWTFFYKFSLTFLKCHQDEVLQLYDLSEILNMVKLKNIKKDINENKSPRIRFDESGQISELESMKRYSDTSSISPTRQGGSLTRKGGLFSRMFGKEAPITSESFKEDAVWERLINLSCKEWEEDFNENFVNQLLQSFDPEKLVFNQSFPNTPKEVSVVYSANKKSRAELIMDPSPPNNIKQGNDKRGGPGERTTRTAALQKKQKKEPKLQIIVNDNGIRNPRQANLVFVEQQSKTTAHQKQTRSQQSRDYKPKQQPIKRNGP